MRGWCCWFLFFVGFLFQLFKLQLLGELRSIATHSPLPAALLPDLQAAARLVPAKTLACLGFFAAKMIYFFQSAVLGSKARVSHQLCASYLCASVLAQRLGTNLSRCVQTTPELRAGGRQLCRHLSAPAQQSLRRILVSSVLAAGC